MLLFFLGASWSHEGSNGVGPDVDNIVNLKFSLFKKTDLYERINLYFLCNVCFKKSPYTFINIITVHNIVN